RNGHQGTIEGAPPQLRTHMAKVMRFGHVAWVPEVLCRIVVPSLFLSESARWSRGPVRLNSRPLSASVLNRETGLSHPFPKSRLEVALGSGEGTNVRNGGPDHCRRQARTDRIARTSSTPTQPARLRRFAQRRPRKQMLTTCSPASRRSPTYLSMLP